MTGPTLKSARSFNELANSMKNTRVTIKVLAGFLMQGREPTKPGEILQVSRSFAAELCSADKAEVIPTPPPAPDPNQMPQFGSPPAEKTVSDPKSKAKP